MATIENCYFYYARIAEPGLKYQTTDQYTYSVDCCVSKTQAKEWNKIFAKQKTKSFDNEEFERIFKTPPPFPEQDEQFIIKLKKEAQYIDKETGDIVLISQSNRPRVYDSEKNDITQTLIGNGSSGGAAYEEFSNNYGNFARLKAIRVDNLVTYEKKAHASEDELFVNVKAELGHKSVTPGKSKKTIDSGDPF